MKKIQPSRDRLSAIQIRFQMACGLQPYLRIKEQSKNQNERFIMALIKYNRPNTDLFSKTFNDIVDEFFTEQNYRKDSFIPSVDISEDEKHFMISATLPGMKKEDIGIINIILLCD